MEVMKRGLGKFYIENKVKDGEGTRVLRKFLIDTIVQIAGNSNIFIQKVGHPPFVYREKQLHTVVAPAIAKTSEAFLMESPVEREWSSITRNEESDSKGWVDYWCLYKDYNYYIELKHGYVSYRNKSINQRVRDEWQVACNQLNVIQKEINIQKELAKGIFKIALHVIYVYKGASDKNKLDCDFDSSTILQMQQQAMNEISDTTPANWSCLWMLHKDLVDVYEYTNTCESYPAVLFLANISEIEKR